MTLIGSTKIEVMKRRWHGDATLRFLGMADDHKRYKIIGTAQESFVLGREYDSATSQLVGVLTLDMERNGGITIEALRTKALFVDMVKSDLTFERWRFQTATPPQQYFGTRYVCYVSGAFNDKTEIATI